MEKDQLEVMPYRRKPKQGTSKFQPVTLSSNLYGVCFKESPSIEQYVLDTEPSIQDEGTSLLRKVVEANREKLDKEINILAFKGKMIWGNLKVTKPMIFEVKKGEHKQIHQDFQVIIKHTKSIHYEQIVNLPPKQQRQLIQIYNIVLKQNLFGFKMKQTSRNRYIKVQNEEEFYGYKVLQCYDLKLTHVMREIKLIIDVSFRILNNMNALEEICALKSKEEQMAFVQDKTVITTYNNRTYRVVRLRYDLSPLSTFQLFNRSNIKQQQTYKVIDYLKDYHNVLVLAKKQPLLEVIIGFDYQMVDGKKVKTPIPGFLVPEVCRFSAQLLKIKENKFQAFKEISKAVKISPVQRKEIERQLVSKLNDNPGIMKINEQTDVKGIVIQNVEIESQGRTLSDSGNIDLRSFGKPKQPMKLDENQWMIVYSNYKNSKEYDDVCQRVFENFYKSSGVFGIKLKEPLFIKVQQQGAQSWIDEIADCLKDDKKLKENIKIIVLIFQSFEKNYYGKLKKFITSKLKLPCQMVLSKKLFHRSALTIFGKILLQMNAKIGCPLWIVRPKHELWKKKRIMYGGLAISKNNEQKVTKNHNEKQAMDIQRENKMSHVLSLVGTISEDLSKVFSNTMMLANEQQLYKKETYEKLMIDWIKSCFIEMNNKMPEVIVLYREGLTEKQLDSQGRAEIQAIEKVVERARVRQPGYYPQIMYIMVVKKSSKRVYQTNNSPSNPGKFRPAFTNPAPGTVLFEKISTEKAFDFHMTAQNVTEGTSTLTQYIIAYDKSEISDEAIAQFTLEQCYNYPNWMGAIKVPGCLQSAQKLAKLVGEHIHQDVGKGDQERSVQNLPFYL